MTRGGRERWGRSTRRCWQGGDRGRPCRQLCKGPTWRHAGLAAALGSAEPDCAPHNHAATPAPPLAPPPPDSPRAHTKAQSKPKNNTHTWQPRQKHAHSSNSRSARTRSPDTVEPAVRDAPRPKGYRAGGPKDATHRHAAPCAAHRVWSQIPGSVHSAASCMHVVLHGRRDPGTARGST